MKFFNLFDRKVECNEFPHLEEFDEEDDLSYEEQTIDKASQFVPSFQMMFHAVQNLTMTIPRMHSIEGFRLAIGTPLSNNFIVQHEFNLSPQPPKEQNNMMAMLGSNKLPFY